MSDNPNTLPFKFSMDFACDRQVREVNKSWHRKGAAKLEPSLKALERMKGQRTANESRVSSWTDHPDDRVVAAYFRRAQSFSREFGMSRYYWRDQAEIMRARRGAEDSARTPDGGDAIWSPLLDQAVYVRSVGRPEVGYYSYGRKPDPDWVDERMGRLREWLATDPDPADVAFVFDTFEASPLRLTVARNTVRWSGDLFEKVLGWAEAYDRKNSYNGQTETAGRKALVENPALEEAHVRRIAERHRHDWVRTTLLRHFSCPADLREELIQEIEAETRKQWGARRLNAGDYAAMLALAAGGELNERVAQLIADDGEIYGGMLQFGVLLHEDGLAHPEDLDPAHVQAYFEHLMREDEHRPPGRHESLQRAWDLLAQKPDYFRARLTPTADWAERLFRATLDANPGLALRQFGAEEHPWIANLPDADRAFLDTLKALRAAHCHLLLDAVRKCEGGRWHLVGPDAEVEATIWRDLVQNHPEEAFSWIGGTLRHPDEGEEGCWVLNEMAAEEIAPMFNWRPDPSPASPDQEINEWEISRRLERPTQNLAAIVRHWPVCLTHPETRGNVADLIAAVAPSPDAREFYTEQKWTDTPREEFSARTAELAEAVRAGRDVEAFHLAFGFEHPEEPGTIWDPERALDVLEDPQYLRHANLSPEVLVPFLKNPDGNVRQRAILVAGKLRQAQRVQDRKAPSQ